MPILTLLLGVALIIISSVLIASVGPIILVGSIAGGWLVGTALAEMMYY